MIDLMLSIVAALAAFFYFGDWLQGESHQSFTLLVWSLAFAVYACRVHRMKRRWSQRNVGELLKTLRETL
jgi:hypothetical protein